MNLENVILKQLWGGAERNSLMYIITHKTWDLNKEFVDEKK
jgi:hypothetical protein